MLDRMDFLRTFYFTLLLANKRLANLKYSYDLFIRILRSQFATSFNSLNFTLVSLFVLGYTMTIGLAIIGAGT